MEWCHQEVLTAGVTCMSVCLFVRVLSIVHICMYVCSKVPYQYLFVYICLYVCSTNLVGVARPGFARRPGRGKVRYPYPCVRPLYLLIIRLQW